VSAQTGGGFKMKGMRMKVENAMMSDSGQQALKDMVELQMYLVAQVHGKPWPLLPRSVKFLSSEPHCSAVDSNVADELFGLGCIERTSSQTFVVSKFGREFYLREIKLHSDLDDHPKPAKA
jgi:hypothetical protein